MVKLTFLVEYQLIWVCDYPTTVFTINTVYMHYFSDCGISKPILKIKKCRSKISTYLAKSQIVE